MQQKLRVLNIIPLLYSIERVIGQLHYPVQSPGTAPKALGPSSINHKCLKKGDEACIKILTTLKKRIPIKMKEKKQG